jgi:hypothetical protein
MKTPGKLLSGLTILAFCAALAVPRGRPLLYGGRLTSARRLKKV